MNAVRNLSVIGFAFIIATQGCFVVARRQRSPTWETAARFFQAGVIVVYTIMVTLAIQTP